MARRPPASRHRTRRRSSGRGSQAGRRWRRWSFSQPAASVRSGTFPAQARHPLERHKQQEHGPILAPLGGTTTGKVSGKILNGGADYQLAGSSGTTLDARYTLAPSDGSFIIVRNCGPMNALIPAFETATSGPHAYLNTGKFLSSPPGAGSGGVSITFSERK